MKKVGLVILILAAIGLFVIEAAYADDSFNRPDGKLAVRDANNNYVPWVPINSSNTSILSNQVVPDGHNPDGSGTLDGAIWQEQYQPGAPTTDQEWYYTLRKGAGTPTQYHWTVLARGATANAYTGQSLYSGYDVRIFNDGTFQLFRTDANVLNWQDQATVAPPNNGDAIGIRAYGSIIQGWYCHAGTCTQILQHSDGFYQSGYGGFMISQLAGVRGDVALDDFTSTMPAGGPVACNSCPDYVEYTGAAQQYSTIKHNVRLHSRAAVPPVGATLDPGDVFKINASRTAYDWQNAAALKGPGGPGFCGGSDPTANWCSVVLLNQVPLTINTYKMVQKSPTPTCDVDLWTFVVYSQAFSYSGRIHCQSQEPTIVGTNTLHAPLALRDISDAMADDVSDLTVGKLWGCPTQTTSGKATWYQEEQWNVITPDAHIHHGGPVRSLGYVIQSSRQNPHCAP